MPADDPGQCSRRLQPGGTAIHSRLARFALVALVVLFPAAGARADEVCAIARILLATEMSSEALLKAPGEAAAAAAVRELEARLDRVSAHVVRLGRSEGARAKSAEPMARFIEHRRRLARHYRTLGLVAARKHALDAGFIEAGEAVREVLRRHPACLPTDERVTPPDAREASADDRVMPPDERAVGADRRVASAEDRSARSGATGGDGRKAAGGFPSRPGPPGREGWARAAGPLEAPPGTRIWLGIAVLAALCLLLIAVLLFDSSERREDPRFACHVPARLSVRGEERRVVIVEISRGGAKLRTAQGFTVGERGVMPLLGVPTDFKVVWATPAFCGVCFRHKLDVPSEQLERLSVAEPRPEPLAGSPAAV